MSFAGLLYNITYVMMKGSNKTFRTKKGKHKHYIDSIKMILFIAKIHYWSLFEVLYWAT